MFKKLFCLFSMLWLLNAFAGTAAPVATNPAQEARVQALSEQLRCLVCQNQNLADSHAELAIDLKNQVREMVAKGRSDREIIDYMVQRYGDFVLYNPPFKVTTILLWVGPFALLFGGLLALFVKLRRRKEKMGRHLTAEERDAARRLLETDGQEAA